MAEGRTEAGRFYLPGGIDRSWHDSATNAALTGNGVDRLPHGVRHSEMRRVPESAYDNKLAAEAAVRATFAWDLKNGYFEARW
jgi:hypothetical protein